MMVYSTGNHHHEGATTMSPDPPLTRLFGISNPWQLMSNYMRDHPGEPTVYLSYRNAQSGTGGGGAAWQVRDIIHRRTDDEENGWWGDHGLKTFDVFTYGDRRATLAAAQAWATERYEVPEWAVCPRTRGGTAVVPKPVADMARLEIARARGK